MGKFYPLAVLVLKLFFLLETSDGKVQLAQPQNTCEVDKKRERFHHFHHTTDASLQRER